MKQFILLFTFVLLGFHQNSSAQANDLFISEYIEGSGNVKYLEIFNGTGSDINLSNYEIRLFANGSTDVSTNSLTSISGILANGQVLVIANAAAEVKYSGEKIESNVTYFNGDDAVAIWNKSTNSYTDIFGKIGERPTGGAWTQDGITTINKTLRRKSNVSSGVSVNPSAGFPTLSSEWEMFDQDDISDLGKHTFDVAQHIGETNFTLDSNFQFQNEIFATDWLAKDKQIESGFELFRFFANEGGENLDDDDDLPTTFTNMNLLVTGFEEIAEIGVFFNDSKVGSTTSVSSLTQLDINASLADGTQGTFSVKALLKNTARDHEQINVDISRVVVSDEGSGFVQQTGSAILESGVTSNQSLLQVEATKVIHHFVLSEVQVNKTFKITINAVNDYNSIDLDETSAVHLSLSTGESALNYDANSPADSYLEAGAFTWTLSYPAVEDISISVSSNLGTLSIPLRIVEDAASGLYESIAPNLTGEALITYLRDNYQVTNSLGYNTARDRMFMDIDNKKVNGMGASVNTLECVYTGKLATNYSNRSQAQDSFNFNTEHTWPQSFFNENEPMKSDLHHLFPTDETANGARSNYPFKQLEASQVNKWFRLNEVSTTAPAANIQGEYSKSASTSFEPRDIHKGNVARAIFYFWTIYGGRSNVSDDAAFFNGMKNDLLIWHRLDKSDEAEIIRTHAIEGYQGNINPFVVDTSLVARAFFPETISPIELKHENQMPESFTLYQNYPNPFNPNTTIKYDLKASGQVSIRVYDVLGKQVSVLVNAPQSAGTHRISFDAQNLASGIYFVKMETAQGVQIRSMSLIK